jgi:hypothetical protein
MTNEKAYFGIGLVVGVILAGLFLYYFAPRYNTVKSSDTLIKQDRWTGRSWRYVDNQWKAIVDVNRDWTEIDQALRAALKLPFANVDTGSALTTLRKTHPVLSDLSDEDLLERIKLVYSKQIICNMYLDSFLKAQNASTQAQ